MAERAKPLLIAASLLLLILGMPKPASAGPLSDFKFVRHFNHNGFPHTLKEANLPTKASSLGEWGIHLTYRHDKAYKEKQVWTKDTTYSTKTTVLSAKWNEGPSNFTYSRNGWKASKKAFLERVQFGRVQASEAIFSPDRMASVAIHKDYANNPAVQQMAQAIYERINAVAYPLEEKEVEYDVALSWNPEHPMTYQLQVTPQENTTDKNVWVQLHLDGISNERYSSLTQAYSTTAGPVTDKSLICDNEMPSKKFGTTLNLPLYTFTSHKWESNYAQQEYYFFDYFRLQKLFFPPGSTSPKKLAGDLSAKVFKIKNRQRIIIGKSAKTRITLDRVAEIIYTDAHDEDSYGVSINRPSFEKRFTPQEMGHRISKNQRTKLFFGDEVRLGWLDGVTINFVLYPGKWRIRANPDSLTESGRNGKQDFIRISLAHQGGNDQGSYGETAIGFVFDGAVSIALDTAQFFGGGPLGSIGNFLAGNATGNATRWGVGWFYGESDEDHINWLNIRPKGTEIGMELQEEGLKIFLIEGAAVIQHPGGNEVSLDTGELSIASSNGNFSNKIQYSSNDLSSTMQQIMKEKPEAHMSPRMATNEIHQATQQGNLSDVSYLLEKGANPNALDSDGNSAIFYAIKEGHTEIFRLFWHRDANFKSVNKLGTNALIFAAFYGQLDMVRILFNMGVIDPNVLNHKGDSALKFAAINGSPEIIDLLVGEGAMVNFQNDKKVTALYWACVKGNYEAVAKLIELGADVNMPRFDGVTPLEKAQLNGHHKIVELLKQHGAN